MVVKLTEEYSSLDTRKSVGDKDARQIYSEILNLFKQEGLNVTDKSYKEVSKFLSATSGTPGSNDCNAYIEVDHGPSVMIFAYTTEIYSKPSVEVEICDNNTSYEIYMKIRSIVSKYPGWDILNHRFSKEYQQTKGDYRIRTDSKGSRKIYDYIGKLLKEFGVKILDTSYEDPDKYCSSEISFDTMGPNAFYQVDSQVDRMVIDIFGWTTPDDVEFVNAFAVTYSDNPKMTIHPEFNRKLKAFIAREGLDDWTVMFS